MKKFGISLLIAVCGLLPAALPAQAQTMEGVNLEEKFMLNQTDSVASKFPSIGSLVTTILPNVFIIAGLILFFIIIGAGFTLIRSSNNPEAKDKGKRALMGAIIGFGVVFASYWIVQIIEIITGANLLHTTLLNP